MLLQLVPGGNLQDLVRLYGPIVDPECRESENPGENLVAWYAVQLCRAVEYLHGKQIMSRDIKDENCMVNQYDGTLVLIDFGTHKDMSDIQPVTASFAGTPMTMSKARLTNKPYGIEEDIYSVGETIRGLCGATNKFEGNLNEFRVFRNDHTSMDSINTDWPDAIKAFLKACFADVKVRPSASKLLSDQELFCTQKLRAFDSAAKAAAVSTTTLSPGKAADHVVRMDTATTTAWSQVQPRKQITRNFIALLTEEESVVCELWAGSIGRGLQAVTPRIIPGAAHVPSYFNELLKICRKIIESFAYRKQEVLPWATQEIGKILDSQETSQFELEQTLRLFAFKINEQGGLNTSGGFGGQAAKPHAHFLIPMLREPSAGFHAHQIFHIRKLCDQATEQVLGCLKAATKKHIASSAPLRTPAFALKAGGPSIRRGGGRGMGTRKKSGNTLTVPDGGGGGGGGSGEVPRESSLGARRGLSPSGLSLSTLSTGTSDSLDAGSGPLPTPNIYDGGGDGGGGGADHGAAAQFSEGGPSRAQPFSMGMSDVGMLLERVVETGELLTKIVGDLMAARSHSGGSSGDDSGIEGPRRGKKKKAASNVVDPGGLLYAFIVIELKLPESCATMLLNEEITLDILLEDITRDDLVAVGLAIGPRAKIWAEICKERKAPGRRGSSLQSRQSLTTLGGGGGGGGPAHTAVKTAFSTNTNTIVEILDEKADVVQMNMEDLHEIPIQTQKAKSFEFLPQPQSSGTASRGSLQQARALSQERARNEGSASARKPDGELAGTDRGTLQLDLGGGAALGGTSSSDGAGSKVEASVELRGSDASMVFPAAGGGGSGSVGGDGGGGGGGGGGGAEGEAHEASSVTMRGSSESGVTALRVHSSFEYSPEETEFIIEERLSAPDSVALAASATKFRESMGSASNVLVENFVIEDDGKVSVTARISREGAPLPCPAALSCCERERGGGRSRPMQYADVHLILMLLLCVCVCVCVCVRACSPGQAPNIKQANLVVLARRPAGRDVLGQPVCDAARPEPAAAGARVWVHVASWFRPRPSIAVCVLLRRGRHPAAQPRHPVAGKGCSAGLECRCSERMGVNPPCSLCCHAALPGLDEHLLILSSWTIATHIVRAALLCTRLPPHTRILPCLHTYLHNNEVLYLVALYTYLKTGIMRSPRT